MKEREKQLELLEGAIYGETSSLLELKAAGGFGICGGDHQIMFKQDDYIAIFVENPLGCQYDLNGFYITPPTQTTVEKFINYKLREVD